jgi:hypothetical protein
MMYQGERSPRLRRIINNQLDSGIGITFDLVVPRENDVSTELIKINHVDIAKVAGVCYYRSRERLAPTLELLTTTGPLQSCRNRNDPFTRSASSRPERSGLAANH